MPQPKEPTFLRSLMLINDEHGFIRAGQLFRPGWKHQSQGALDPIPLEPWSDQEEYLERELVRGYRAARVYSEN